MRPRPSLAMKLMASGVTRSAAIVRSPSFSRSSSSTTITIRPSRISLMALSMLSKAMDVSRPDLREPLLAEEFVGQGRSVLHDLAGEQPFEIATQQVHLDIDETAGSLPPEGRYRQRVGDKAHREGLAQDLDEGETHPVDGDRAFGRQVNTQGRGKP